MGHNSHLYLDIPEVKVRRQRLQAKDITNIDDNELPSSWPHHVWTASLSILRAGSGNERKRPMYELPDREQLPQ